MCVVQESLLATQSPRFLLLRFGHIGATTSHGYWNFGIPERKQVFSSPGWLKQPDVNCQPRTNPSMGSFEASSFRNAVLTLPCIVCVHIGIFENGSLSLHIKPEVKRSLMIFFPQRPIHVRSLNFLISYFQLISSVVYTSVGNALDSYSFYHGCSFFLGLPTQCSITIGIRLLSIEHPFRIDNMVIYVSLWVGIG